VLGAFTHPLSSAGEGAQVSRAHIYRHRHAVFNGVRAHFLSGLESFLFLETHATVKLHWRIALLVGCVALIGGAVIAWHFARLRASQRKFTDQANIYRLRAEHGDAEAQYHLAGMFYRGQGVPQDYGEAFALYRKAAEQGNAKAEYGLAYMFREGKGVPRDSVAAVSWGHRAADQGYAKAQYALGSTYYEGKDVPQDYITAASWYRKAADQGYAEAETYLGYMYSNGLGVAQDDAEAIRWFRKAAEQGYVKAESQLGYMYSVGRGVPRNYGEAARWYGKASRHGDEYARRALDSMRIGFSTGSRIILSGLVLASSLLLISSRGSMRTVQQGKVTVAGLLCLLWVALKIYGYSHFGLLQSLSIVNVFYFGKSLLAGLGVAMLISFLWAKGAKTLLPSCGVLFIAVNIYAIAHYGLPQLRSCPPAFYSINGMLTGMAISSISVLYLERQKSQAVTMAG